MNTDIRYTVFKKETDAPEKVNALISELKEKQSNYDTSRFLPIFYSGGKQGEKNVEYWHNLLGSDWDNFNEEKRNDAADELMKILEERFGSDHTDDVKEEMDMMNSLNTSKRNISRLALTELLNG